MFAQSGRAGGGGGQATEKASHLAGVSQRRQGLTLEPLNSPELVRADFCRRPLDRLRRPALAVAADAAILTQTLAKVIEQSARRALLSLSQAHHLLESRQVALLSQSETFHQGLQIGGRAQAPESLANPAGL